MIMLKSTVVLISAAFLINIAAIVAIQNAEELNGQNIGIEELNDNIGDSTKNPTRDTHTTEPDSVKHRDKEVRILEGPI